MLKYLSRILIFCSIFLLINYLLQSMCDRMCQNSPVVEPLRTPIPDKTEFFKHFFRISMAKRFHVFNHVSSNVFNKFKVCIFSRQTQNIEQGLLFQPFNQHPRFVNLGVIVDEVHNLKREMFIKEEKMKIVQDPYVLQSSQAAFDPHQLIWSTGTKKSPNALSFRSLPSFIWTYRAGSGMWARQFRLIERRKPGHILLI